MIVNEILIKLQSSDIDKTKKSAKTLIKRKTDHYALWRTQLIYQINPNCQSFFTPKYDEIISFEFLHHDFVPLCVKEFSTIHITITDVAGNPILTNSISPTYLQLVFANVWWNVMILIRKLYLF